MLAVLIMVAVVASLALEAALDLLGEDQASRRIESERQMNRPFKVASARLG